jgi:uncharacterized protein YhaN
MDSATLRKSVWEEMLYAEMRANYFGELVSQYETQDKWLRVATLVASSEAVATALPAWPTPLKLVAPIAAAGASFWLLLSQYGSKSRDAAELNAGWSSIRHDYERLWAHLDVAHAEAEYHQIYDRADAYSKAGTKFPNHAKRLEYWLDHASALARYS